MNIDNLLKSRRTIRKFKQTPVEKELLLKYVDMARVAPSGGNLQPLKYVVVSSKEMTDKLFSLVKWAAYLAPLYSPAEDEKPVAYIVVCGDTEIKKSDYDIDAGAAIENIIISAWGDGVGSCWMGAIDRPEIKKLLNLPEHLGVLNVVALGYPAETPEEVKMGDSVKYYLNEDGVLSVPKRSMDDVIIDII